MPSTDPKAYGSSWYAATKVASPMREPLAVEADVDVCVIGGGIAGLTVAREVARRGWSVVVLETHRVAWNASGRNTGFVQPGYAAPAESLVTRVGVDHARELWKLSEAGAEYIRTAIRETNMPGAELAESGWLHVSKTGNDPAIGTLVDLLGGKFGAEVEAWPAERVRAVLRSPLYFNAIHYPRGFTIHPLNYALGLAADAEKHGARIYEQTAALEIDPAGVRKRVVTKGPRVRAAHVVLAGNVHLYDLLPEIADTLSPVFTYVITTAPLGPALAEAISYPGAVSDTDLADNHYRVVAGDRLIWSGRGTVWRDRPKRYLDALVGDIARAYPQLGPVKVEYAWTGTIGNTVHRMPQIGEISSGLWLLSGFGGHGLSGASIGGELLARAIVDGDRTWRAFAPFEMVWAGGKFGRVAQQAYYWSFRMHERIDGWLARQREAKRRAGAGQSAAATATASDVAASSSAAVLPDVQFDSGELPAELAPPKRRRRRRKKTALEPDEMPARLPEGEAPRLDGHPDQQPGKPG